MMYSRYITLAINWFKFSNTFWLEWWSLHWRGYLNYITSDPNWQWLERHYNNRVNNI